jgi:hypothetical protein
VAGFLLECVAGFVGIRTLSIISAMVTLRRRPRRLQARR